MVVACYATTQPSDQAALSGQLQPDSLLFHMGTSVEVTLYQDAFSHFDKETLQTFQDFNNQLLSISSVVIYNYHPSMV